jgi:D-methionine transport system substrate-binding protein
LKFTEVEAARPPRILGQLDLALINTNYALAAKPNPAKDGLVIKDVIHPMPARPDNKDRSAMKKLPAAVKFVFRVTGAPSHMPATYETAH